MNGTKAEKWLAILYPTASILSLISLICIVTTWRYWTWTLNICFDIDCGCILYGVNTYTTFKGGNAKLCHFGTYGPIPAILIGIVLGFYHWYRSCISRQLDEPKIASQIAVYQNRNDIDGDVMVVMPKGRSPCKHWMPPTFLAALICCLSLVHAVVVTDGYYKTCEQYKKNLIQLLGSRGHEAEVVHNRLSCGAIFDFMDYLQPDANNWRRGDEMNTGVALQCAIVTSWFNVFTWLIIFVINFLMTRNKYKKLGQACCC